MSLLTTGYLPGFYRAVDFTAVAGLSALGGYDFVGHPIMMMNSDGVLSTLRKSTKLFVFC